MKNTNLIALLIAVATVSAVSAGYYVDGVYYHGVRPRHVVGDTVEGTAHATGRAVRETGHVAKEVVEAPLDILGVGRRHERREQRRTNKVNEDVDYE